MSRIKSKYESSSHSRLKSIVIARPAAIPSPLTGRSSPIPQSIQKERPLNLEATRSNVEQIQLSSSNQSNVNAAITSEVKSEVKLEVKSAPDNSSIITTFLSDEPIGPAKPIAATVSSDPKPDAFEVVNSSTSFPDARTTCRKLPPALFGPPELSLENVLLPADLLSRTPSMKDGLDAESEIDLRILGCELIQTSGILLKLPQVAMASGQVLYQRFFYIKSFVRMNYEVVAEACISLASKVEEAPRRVRDVINVFHHIRQYRDKKEFTAKVLDQAYINEKNEIIKAERRLLKELGFCVHVKHPHKFIFATLQALDHHRNQPLVQCAWNYMNDSFRTNVFVRFPPESIACACIYLAARQLQVPLPTRPPWYWLFNVKDEEVLREIAVSILRLYSRRPPDRELLEKRCNELREQFNKVQDIASSQSPAPPRETSPLVSQLKADPALDLPQSPAAAAESSVKADLRKASKSDTLPNAKSGGDSSQAHRSHHSKSVKRSHSKSASPAPARSRSRSADKKRRHGGSVHTHRRPSQSRSHSRSYDRHLAPLERDDTRITSEIIPVDAVAEAERRGNVRARLEDRVGEQQPHASGRLTQEMRDSRREENLATDLHALRHHSQAAHSGSSSGSDRDEPSRGSGTYPLHERKRSSPYAVPSDDRYGPAAIRVNERERYRPLVEPYPLQDRLWRDEYGPGGHRSDLQLRRNRIERP